MLLAVILKLCPSHELLGIVRSENLYVASVLIEYDFVKLNESVLYFSTGFEVEHVAVPGDLVKQYQNVIVSLLGRGVNFSQDIHMDEVVWEFGVVVPSYFGCVVLTNFAVHTGGTEMMRWELYVRELAGKVAHVSVSHSQVPKFRVVVVFEIGNVGRGYVAVCYGISRSVQLDADLVYSVLSGTLKQQVPFRVHNDATATLDGSDATLVVQCPDGNEGHTGRRC